MLSRRLAVALGWLVLSHASALADDPAQTIACDVCLPPTVVKPIQTLFEPGFQLNVGGQYTSSGTLLEGSQSLSNPLDQYLDSLNMQVQLGYNIEQNVGVQLTLPYLTRSWRRPFNGAIQNGSTSGLGDISLTANFAPVQQFSEDSTLVLNFTGGLKLPTGDSSYLAEELPGATGHDEEQARELYPVRYHGDHVHEEDEPALPASGVHGHDIALGSGSVDGLVGGTLFFRQDDFFLNAGCQAQLRTQGSYGYRFGNLFTWNVGPGFTPVRNEDMMMGLELDLAGEHKGRDASFGVPNDHDFDFLYLGPQLWVSSQDLSAQLGVDIPLSQDVGELQVVPDYRVKLNLTWRL